MERLLKLGLLTAGILLSGCQGNTIYLGTANTPNCAGDLANSLSASTSAGSVLAWVPNSTVTWNWNYPASCAAYGTLSVQRVDAGGNATGSPMLLQSGTTFSNSYSTSGWVTERAVVTSTTGALAKTSIQGTLLIAAGANAGTTGVSNAFSCAVTATPSGLGVGSASTASFPSLPVQFVITPSVPAKVTAAYSFVASGAGLSFSTAIPTAQSSTLSPSVVMNATVGGAYTHIARFVVTSAGGGTALCDSAWTVSQTAPIVGTAPHVLFTANGSSSQLTIPQSSSPISLMWNSDANSCTVQFPGSLASFASTATFGQTSTTASAGAFGTYTVSCTNSFGTTTASLLVTSAGLSLCSLTSYRFNVTSCPGGGCIGGGLSGSAAFILPTDAVNLSIHISGLTIADNSVGVRVNGTDVVASPNSNFSGVLGKTIASTVPLYLSSETQSMTAHSLTENLDISPYLNAGSNFISAYVNVISATNAKVDVLLTGTYATGMACTVNN